MLAKYLIDQFAVKVIETKPYLKKSFASFIAKCFKYKICQLKCQFLYQCLAFLRIFCVLGIKKGKYLCARESFAFAGASILLVCVCVCV